MGLVKEFKEFALKGNVVDLAVGLIIGAAFGKIVSSLVSDVLMPPLGALIGSVDFSGLAVQILPASDHHPAVVIRYGAFINTVVDFIIVALAIFVVVKAMNTLRRQEAKGEVPPPPPTRDQQLLTEIRDLLKQQKSAS